MLLKPDITLYAPPVNGVGTLAGPDSLKSEIEKRWMNATVLKKVEINRLKYINSHLPQMT